MRRLGVALLFAAVPLVAARPPVTMNGKGVDGAEICVFKTGNASDPISRFLSSSAVTCSAEIPKDEWNVFARKGETLISDRVTAPGTEITVVPAATITAALPDGVSLFAYVPRTRSAIPVIHGSIPADTDVIPLTVAAGKIVAIAPKVNVPAGGVAKVECTPPRDGRADVVAVVAAREGSDSAVPPPLVVVETSGRNERPVDPLRSTAAEPALLFFRDVPASGSKLVLSGKRWKTTEVPITAKSGVVVLDPLVATQTSKLEVSWWAPVDPAKLTTKQSDCTVSKRAIPFFEKRSTETKFVAILNACTPNPNRVAGPACKEVTRRELPFDALRGTLTFEDTPAGEYEMEFDYPGLPPVGSKTIEVGSCENTSVDVPLHYISFFGKVTRGGKPVHVHVYGAVTDPATGEYNAVVTRLPPAGNLAEVLPCDGSDAYRLVPDEPPKENAAFDIDIPDNAVTVEVRDQDTGAPIPHARITMAALHPGEKSAAHFVGTAGQTDDDGKLTIAPVLQNRMLKICAGRDDYRDACAPDFKMEGISEKRVALTLTKARVRQGRVTGGAGVGAKIVWFSPVTGKVTEMIRTFKEDGSFTYKNDHAPGEIMVVIAADRPLYAFLQPPLEPDSIFEITRPVAPIRSFTVGLSDTSKERVAWAALSIGNVIVPANAIGWHLMVRQTQPSFKPGGTVLISDILETGPIRVILIPASSLAAYPNRDVELPLVPEAASFPHQDLGANESITFP